MLQGRYPSSLSDTQRVAKIRDNMAGNIEERNLRANAQKNDAPGCTVKALNVLVEYLIAHAEVATGLKSVHDVALLNTMWHTFGRAIDTCFARKQQLSIAASGELFFRVARMNTSVVQGPERWHQRMLHAFGFLFVCYEKPSEYLFPLVPRYVVSDLTGGQTYTQEEAVFYWKA
ncbi:hypothetical protein PC116_g20576 [Phytophthora cactorum]|uniref:Uncharacterized protein n=1 Tax=Phytophthora cactorum TaxID=29920 RepID=A0A329RHP4_9STRA|nr:hypothetical protein Pcac1_g20911 [Phytophthora cactorum]KAG2889188.1 hypothetical protein PC114_g18069 [Phytophthora cactorum]KAG2921335.1 hypothetical protein PC117_g16265 [Phytophthora cactorum]KAG3002435.1 hypothetical protein PC119_g16315 [Phytophthora cactorum]KAG3150509.1 hypothetical protein C6341_g16803 [Phytophthora cactorum]